LAGFVATNQETRLSILVWLRAAWKGWLDEIGVR
jgi:hypothetical protein